MSSGAATMPGPVAGRRWPAPLPAAASLLLHGLVLLLLINTAQQHRGGARAAARLRARSIVITLGPEVPQQQTSKPQQTPPLSPLPMPQPTAAAAAARAPAHRASPPAQAPAAAPPAPPPVPQQDPDDVLGSIHDNWLEPPGLKQAFICHVRIDYQAGGIITKITFAPGCGNAVLVDSISRAIWKTQPLPLSKDNNKAGSMEFDLTP